MHRGDYWPTFDVELGAQIRSAESGEVTSAYSRPRKYVAPEWYGFSLMQDRRVRLFAEFLGVGEEPRTVQQGV